MPMIGTRIGSRDDRVTAVGNPRDIISDVCGHRTQPGTDIARHIFGIRQVFEHFVHDAYTSLKHDDGA